MSSYDFHHDINRAEIYYGYQRCLGHRVTKYYCGAKCHDCGTGFCYCITIHCCCPQNNNDSNNNDGDNNGQ